MPFSCSEREVDSNSKMFPAGSRAWLEADLAVVQAVLCRSSLHINSELDLFSALSRWATASCSRLQLPVSEENLRRVAGGCQYLVRYLTLTPDQFRSPGGPGGSGLLTEDESDALLLALLRPHSHPALPDHLLPLQRTMSQTRR